ncbi:MAG: YdcF family protein [Lachnospiraceae bacterium]|nr:YdcF family protein [Lachnospiraceae bacterium]
MTALCIIMGGACLLYYLIMFFYIGRSGDFAWFWLLNAAVFLSAVWLRSLAQSWSRVLAGILLAAEGIGILLVIVLGLTILSAACTPEPENMEYYLVLGAWVNGRQPSRALRKRLDKALSCAEKDPDARLILSGGQGDDEEISEAVCMRNYLTAAGVEEDRLILEDRSTSTRENLLFSNKLTGCGGARCGIISNDFHICRVMKLARQAGYRDCYGIPAEGDPVMELHYIVRESVALFMMVLQRS